jgi:peptidoglycan/xylan/chitin deacetylase (PgdA/CDA1 family)
MALLPNPRYSYSAIPDRPCYAWPQSKRLAVYVAVNVEQYRFGQGMIEELVPSGGLQPDVLNYSWCDYGTRVGIWRILELLEEFRIPATLLVNTDLYVACPAVIDEFRKRGDEIACHGRTNSEQQGGLSESHERALIEEATAIIRQKEGHPPKGWLSPWISETAVTPDLLKAAGYHYVLDWCADDQPLWLRTDSGPLLAVPYPQELNDSSTVIGRAASAGEFAGMIVDNFEEMLDQSNRQPLVMGIALHAHISGQPFRLRHLRRAFEHLAAKRDEFWLTRVESIAEHATAHLPSPRE